MSGAELMPRLVQLGRFVTDAHRAVIVALVYADDMDWRNVSAPRPIPVARIAAGAGKTEKPTRLILKDLEHWGWLTTEWGAGGEKTYLIHADRIGENGRPDSKADRAERKGRPVKTTAVKTTGLGQNNRGQNDRAPRLNQPDPPVKTTGVTIYKDLKDKERDPPTPQPAFASQERADLDTFIIQVSPKLSGLELPQRIRKQVDELVTAHGIPAVRAAVAKADESTQHIQNPLAYAASVLRNQAKNPPQPARSSARGSILRTKSDAEFRAKYGNQGG